MSSCRSSPGGARNWHVSDRVYLQLVLSASRIEQLQACWLSLYACDGRGINRSYLERERSPYLQSGSCSLGSTQAARSPSQTSFAGPDCAQTTTRSASEGCLKYVHRLMGVYRILAIAPNRQKWYTLAGTRCGSDRTNSPDFAKCSNSARIVV